MNSTAARGPASALPKNSQFFRPIAWIRNVRSETLLSMVSWPSPTYRRNASHWLRAYVTAFPRADLGKLRRDSSSRYPSIRSRIGTDSS